jgi:hypothetical protein
MNKQAQGNQHTRLFTASEVADFEYCPLAWWHEQFEPWTQADSEVLFARLVELEHEHATQAPDLPEYRLIEQLLLRRGAFAKGQQQHEEHAQAVAASETGELTMDQDGASILHTRLPLVVITLLVVLALILLIAGLIWQ